MGTTHPIGKVGSRWVKAARAEKYEAGTEVSGTGMHQ